MMFFRDELSCARKHLDQSREEPGAVRLPLPLVMFLQRAHRRKSRYCCSVADFEDGETRRGGLGINLGRAASPIGEAVAAPLESHLSVVVVEPEGPRY